MNTRSQTKQTIFGKEKELEKEKENIKILFVEIDFDEASEAWRSNKKCIGNGYYKYICSQKTKSGNQCKRESLHFCEYCKIHTPKK